MEAHVECPSCEVRTTYYEDAYAPTADAITAWNRRQTAPETNVDASILRERISRAIFDPGQTEGYKTEKRTLTQWQTDAVMRVLGYATAEGSANAG